MGIPLQSRILAMVALGLAIGASVGVGSYTFIYAEGYSYLLDAPSACANCHVMNEQYDGWLKSSHHAVATCNDCHTPAGALAKYTTKAVNGFWHSFAFTTGGFHEPIRITSRNRAITEGACAKCHEDVVRSLSATHPSPEAFSCIRCHASVGHLH